MNRNSNLIYFNNNRTTQQDALVTESMLRHSGEQEPPGEKIQAIAKDQLAGLLNATPSELLFTSGTTESVNLALKGIYELYKHKGNHIITNVTEHFAVLDCCKELERQGAEVTCLPVDKEGLLDPDALRAAIKPGTIVASLMAANNETGVVQPLEEISGICESRGIHFFSDGSQVVGKLRCDVKELGMDSLAFGAHKMHGPEGIGLLYIHEKHKTLMEQLAKNYKSRLSPAQIAGFGTAAEISRESYWETSAHVSKLKNHFEHQLLDLEGLRINGSTRHRLYNTSNLTFADAGKIIPLLASFDFADNLKKPSYVLQAMGLRPEEIKNSFRFSFGKYNTLEEVKLLVEAIMK